MNIPLYYRIDFKMFAYNNKDDIKLEQFSREFKNVNPIEARNAAFEEFEEEYVKYIKAHDRVGIKKDGNLFITKPTLPAEYFEKDKVIKTNDNQDWSKNTTNFKEEIAITLVLTDKTTRKIFGCYDYKYEIIDEELFKKSRKISDIKGEYVQTELPLIYEEIIHKLSSENFDPQEILDGLDNELQYYNFLKLDTQNKETTIEYYGTDYFEGLCEQKYAYTNILESPYQFISKKPDVEDNIDSDVSKKELPDFFKKKNIDYEAIIEKGEGNQVEFKPSLVYNFNTGKPGLSIKYINAKAICGLLNSKGGILFIGVKDNREIQGLDFDYSLFDQKKKEDKILLEFDDLLFQFFPPFITLLYDYSIERIKMKDVLVVVIYPSKIPVYLKTPVNLRGKSNNYTEEFWFRMTASTRQIKDSKEIQDYINTNRNYDEKYKT